MIEDLPEIIDEETEWRPNARQAEFLAVPTSVRHGFYGGAAGGGKSEVILMDPIVKQLHLHPRFHGIVFRRTFRELEESLIPRAKYLYHRFGGVGSDGGKVFTFPSGAVIRMSYLATDDDAHSHQSAEYNYAAFDELTHFTRYQYFYVYTRVRSSVTGLPSYMRGASNPGGPGHTWVFKEFVEPCESGHVLLKRTMPNGKVERSIFIPAKLTDNKVLLKNDPSYENNLMMLPEAEKRALLYGDWHAFSGQVFSEFRAKRIPTEPDNALHVIEPFDIPEWWPKMVIADWGFTAMTWVGFLAISPDDRAICYREYSCKKKYIAEWGADIARIAQFDGNLRAFVLDPSGWFNRGEPKQIYQQINDATGWRFEQADNDRIGGKLLLHEYLRWMPRPVRYIPPEGYNPDTEARIFRTHGEKAAAQYHTSFEPEAPEKNLPKLLIFKTCPELIAAIQACVPKKTNPEDVEEFDGDDPYDGIRYGLKRVARFFFEAKAEHDRRAKLNIILNKYQEDGNITDFYRRMEVHDAKLAKKLVPIRRFHPSGEAPRGNGFGAQRLSRLFAARQRKAALRG